MNSKISVLKSGSIYFFYRPKVKNSEEAQRFFLVFLASDSNKYTSLVVGKKQLPTGTHDRYFLLVEETNKSQSELLDSLTEKHYQVGKGETTAPISRCLAEGKFIIAKHNNHTHFVYQITNPSQLKEIQQEFHLKKEDDYLISVKNPEFGTMVSKKEKTNYPQNLQEKFGNYRFISLESGEFLDYKGTELLLINKKKQDLTEREKDLQACLTEINSKDLTDEFAKIVSPKTISPLEEK